MCDFTYINIISWFLKVFFYVKWIYFSETHSEHCQTPKTKFYVEIVNGSQSAFAFIIIIIFFLLVLMVWFAIVRSVIPMLEKYCYSNQKMWKLRTTVIEKEVLKTVLVFLLYLNGLIFSSIKEVLCKKE